MAVINGADVEDVELVLVSLCASVGRDVRGILPGLWESTIRSKVALEASNIMKVAQLAVLDVLYNRSGDWH